MNKILDKIEMVMFTYIAAAFIAVLIQFLIKLIYRSL
tara:strand:+ start:123 stop:233 length:111 start_codon:yes stop_codon:yes gene_type:complete